ncbi:unnamed protein product [Ilex paraguariensis]|uniref:HTH La-type RNA-binding domain-containing protein n=1 Tax=Ilex paraguariensis TaxID=185542 RepID=A0ABC8UE48_9AQUA
MAMTADSSTNNHSARSPITSGSDGADIIQSQRRSSLPWAQVVRGSEYEAITAFPRSPSSSSSPSIAAAEQTTSSPKAPLEKSTMEAHLESSDCGNCNVGRTKKLAWKKPLDGVVEVNTVMGGTVSWPALSESTRPIPKSSADSSIPISDKSDSVSQGPIISHTPQKQAKTNANPNFTPNNRLPSRQKSMKHRSAGGGSAQSGFNRPPAPPPPPPPPLFPVFNVHYGHLIPAVLESTVREPPYKGGVGSQSNIVTDPFPQRNSSRMGNFRPRHHGDGMHHNGHGGRRNHEREWNGPRGSSVREFHMPQQMAPPPMRGFIRPSPPGSTSFIAPPPLRPFANPMTFDLPSPYYYVPTLPPDSFRGVSLVPHAPPPPPPMFFSVLDPPLPALLVNQIDYYFSDANLVTDKFLRSNMDDQGWVPITLIASFPRSKWNLDILNYIESQVQNLTHNIQLILDSLRASSVVEVQGDKVRRLNDWRKWISASSRFPADSGSGSQSPHGSTDNVLAASLLKVSLDEVTTNQNSNSGAADNNIEVVTGRCSSEDFTIQSSLANGEDTTEEADSSLT